MAKKKVIRIGVDLDGVIAQHSLGGFWVWLRKLKEKILKKASVSNYYYPSTVFEKLGWRVINWVRKPLADKKGLFASLAKKKGVKFYLITSRFQFLEKLTKRWLKKHKLDFYFHRVLINIGDLDPFEFKTRMIKTLDLDFFIDDDLDSINYLKKKTKARFFWVVPGHKEKSDNHDNRVITCEDFIEALRKIFP